MKDETPADPAASDPGRFELSERKMYLPKDYWASVAEGHDGDASGFGPILHPQAPVWFNQAIDDLQFRAFRRALAIAEIPPNARILDVGCGTGRWVRRYREHGFSPVGVDAAFGMLRIARALQTDAPLILGQAGSLPFADAVFDGLSDITVVQHIPYEFQRKALQEMVRVLRPGGRMILLELIRGQGSHIFPRPPVDWIHEIESCGTSLMGCFGQEFLLLDRLFVRMAQTVSGRRGNSASLPSPLADGSTSERHSGARGVYWKLRRLTVPISAWAESGVAKICPTSLATHAIFVFKKKL